MKEELLQRKQAAEQKLREISEEYALEALKANVKSLEAAVEDKPKEKAKAPIDYAELVRNLQGQIRLPPAPQPLTPQDAERMRNERMRIEPIDIHAGPPAVRWNRAADMIHNPEHWDELARPIRFNIPAGQVVNQETLEEMQQAMRTVRR